MYLYDAIVSAASRQRPKIQRVEVTQQISDHSQEVGLRPWIATLGSSQILSPKCLGNLSYFTAF